MSDCLLKRDPRWNLRLREIDLKSRRPDAVIAIHPNLPDVYRRKLAGLQQMLADETVRPQAQELPAISQKSCGVLNIMGPKIQWLQSFVTDDKIYCVHIAPDEATIGSTPISVAFP